MGAGASSNEYGFPTTVWPEIWAVAQAEPSKAFQALDSVLCAYQAPLKAHLVTKFGLSEDEAADCLHSFIEKKILQKGLLARANQQRGRFRTFLLTALDRFAISECRRQSSLKRTPPTPPLPLHELTEEDELGFAATPSPEFDVAWARTVLAAAIQRLRAECEQKSRSDFWGVFEGRLLKPLLEGSSPTPYDELVASCALESPAHAFNALASAKRSFARHLRAVVQEYSGNGQNAEAELCELRSILAHS